MAGTKVKTKYGWLANCKQCGSEFKVPRPGGKQIKKGNFQLYCSRSCAKSVSRGGKPRPMPVCFRCHALIIRVKGKSGRRLCPVCLEQYERERFELREAPLTCAHCGSRFTRPGRPGIRHCSDECRQSAKAIAKKRGSRNRRKKYGNKYRHRAKKAGVAYEPINVVKVFERDGWRCQICGEATPKRLRGKNKLRSPELDHRVPFALGGAHVYENVQCACHGCNARKSGHTIAGQLPLWARIEDGQAGYQNL